jgi:photosystem II stability/assembly factor-like uncharacterized protein
MWRKLLICSVAVVVMIGATGCIKINKQKTQTSNLGGIFFTDDRFESWKHRSLLMTPGENPGTIGGTNVYFMKFDPSDSEALYAATLGDGLYYSYNGGLGWLRSERLPAGLIRDLVVNPKDKCQLYIGVDIRVYRSDDCARTWKELYFSDSGEKKVSALAIDWYTPTVVYAGLTDGSLLKSDDSGLSWKMVDTFGTRVQKIILDPFDSRNLYLASVDHGLWKSIDKGVTWVDLMPAMQDFKSSRKYYDFNLSASTENLLVYASNYGLLRSLDGGETWSEIKLITPPNAEEIFSVAIDPINPNYIYYSTNSAVYKTVDGGLNWVVKKTPTTRVVSELLIHPTDTSNIFAGVRLIEQ